MVVAQMVVVVQQPRPQTPARRQTLAFEISYPFMGQFRDKMPPLVLLDGPSPSSSNSAKSSLNLTGSSMLLIKETNEIPSGTEQPSHIRRLARLQQLLDVHPSIPILI